MIFIFLFWKLQSCANDTLVKRQYFKNCMILLLFIHFIFGFHTVTLFPIYHSLSSYTKVVHIPYLLGRCHYSCRLQLSWDTPRTHRPVPGELDLPLLGAWDTLMEETLQEAKTPDWGIKRLQNPGQYYNFRWFQQYNTMYLKICKTTVKKRKSATLV